MKYETYCLRGNQITTPKNPFYVFRRDEYTYPHAECICSGLLDKDGNAWFEIPTNIEFVLCLINPVKYSQPKKSKKKKKIQGEHPTYELVFPPTTKKVWVPEVVANDTETQNKDKTPS